MTKVVPLTQAASSLHSSKHRQAGRTGQAASVPQQCNPSQLVPGTAGGLQLHGRGRPSCPLTRGANSLGGQEDGDSRGQGAAGGQLRVDQQQLVGRGLELQAAGRAVAGEAGCAV